MKYWTFFVFAFLIFSNNALSQSYSSSPSFTMGAFTLDSRNSSNSLEKIKGLPDGFKMGIGYEFRLNDDCGIYTGADILLTYFDDKYLEDFTEKAWMRINTNAISFNISPRYYLLGDQDGALFAGIITKLESSRSKAKFRFMEKEDLNVETKTSGYQFQYGLAVGYRFLLNEDVWSTVSLNIVSRDLGASINKLNLEQSGFFKNETLGRSTSVELEVIFSLPKSKRKNRK